MARRLFAKSYAWFRAGFQAIGDTFRETLLTTFKDAGSWDCWTMLDQRNRFSLFDRRDAVFAMLEPSLKESLHNSGRYSPMFDPPMLLLHLSEL